MKQTVRIERLVVGPLSTNCYLLIDTDSHEAIVVDPGDDAEYIIEKIDAFHARPTLILATHGHFDHIMGARAVQLAYAIPFAIHRDDTFLTSRMQKSARHFLGIVTDPPPDITHELKEHESLKLGKTKITVMHVPGHTPGSICLSVTPGENVFVGDTIFAGGAVGRTDFSYSNKQDLASSLKKILSLRAETELFPGHGEPTTVDVERRYHTV